MKKNVFALSVAAALAGFAGTASAQVPFITATGPDAATHFYINAGGVGHILLQPYYTVQGNRNTLMNIINTDTANGKAVKVRFRGARNSDDVFDFYVFLSPGDVWRTRLYRQGEDTHIELPDTSCTLPSRDVVASTPFKVDRVYDQKDVREVREGYVELLTAADIIPGSDLFKAIKHDSVTGKVSCNPSVIEGAMVALTNEDAARAKGLTFPTAGITGHWALTDVTTDSTNTGNLTAVAAGYTPATAPGVAASYVFGKGNLVVAPQNEHAAPMAWRTTGTSDPLLSSGIVPAQFFDFPDLSTPYLNGGTPVDQANHLSEGLAQKSIINEFVVDMGVDFRTDWVVSMPTRRYGVAIDYRGQGAAVYATGNHYFDASNTEFKMVGGVPQVAVTTMTQTYHDDNERTLRATVSPGTLPRLAGEVSVLTFHADAKDSVLGAVISTQRVNPMYNIEKINAGWGELSLSGLNGRGLPVIGYAALQAGGKALGFTWPHASKR
ncbi:hypothetical protein [Vandammella animalimorsus]|uniref:Cell surface protein n=1 Tax=Vandammella animalimorsus TaxID=2029117 RepID=A0A2A2AZN4_9BURK|nr:hypothetical protein [Vandammella animalimorsus]PAT43237.1 hypothetical protein CK621_05235 [Vandammella animalimorsus]